MATQNVTISGKASGVATITVASTTDVTKNAVVTVNVVDGSVSTSSIGGIQVGASKDVTVTLEGDLVGKEADCTVTFSITAADNDDAFVTIVPNGSDKTKAALTGAIANSGGRVGASVSYHGLVYTDDSRVDVYPVLAFTTNLSSTLSVATGAALNLTVVATGGKTPYTYVWKKGGTVISGKTTASITVAAAAASGDAATYTCEVTDAIGTKITSVSCVVTVTA